MILSSLLSETLKLATNFQINFELLNHLTNHFHWLAPILFFTQLFGPIYFLVAKLFPNSLCPSVCLSIWAFLLLFMIKLMFFLKILLASFVRWSLSHATKDLYTFAIYHFGRFGLRYQRLLSSLFFLTKCKVPSLRDFYHLNLMDFYNG